ncbi:MULTISPECIES: pyridoxamine 5'-phosphate oxidase family protein [unclassified Streptomyces]|uniref:helix-turn-helix domain-containing protein n=1 Tax=unclassified Streptomyces TaxID=2593676 RepID=UPI0036E9494B
MNEHISVPAANAPTGPARSDLGRRLVQRRRELGLTLRETADRAGMSANYVRYVEESATAAPGRSVLLQLAGALETTVSALTGGDADSPPGRGQAARRPELDELDIDECWRRLGTHGVGRVASTTAEGPMVLPVNYTVVDGAIIFRTAADSATAQVLGEQVAFEVDHIDEVHGRGWSVVVRGHARSVTRPESLSRLEGLARSDPWAGGRREVWVCVDVLAISGRAIN